MLHNSHPMENQVDQEISAFDDDTNSQSSLSSSEMLAIGLAIIEADEREAQEHEEHLHPLDVDLFILPTDVIALIFCFACVPIPHDTIWRRQCYPLWLASICRAWRVLSLSISELWTTIVVRASQNPNESGYTLQKELLQEWLDRTKGRKLKIMFGQSPEYARSHRAPIPLLQLLIEHCEQWESIEFHLMSSWGDLLRLMTSATTPDPRILALPNLRSLSFVSFHNSSIDAYGRLPTFDIARAPLLRSFDLKGIALERSALTLMPGDQITSTSLSSCRGIRLQDLCKSFPHLRDATFIHTTIIISSQPALHERLTSLTIAFSVDYIQYFRQLTLPALKNLEFRLRGCIMYTKTFSQFIERSACLLTSLTLECFITQEYDLIDLLHALPSLEDLSIIDNSEEVVTGKLSDNGLGSTFFELLHPDEETPYLPNLAMFSYIGILAVQAIDFMEPFIVRSLMRDSLRSASDVDKVAILKKATIKANQYSEVAEFSIAEYSDPQYIWEIVRMVEEGVLVLMNMDGSPWS